MTPFIVEFELNEQDITQIEEKQAEILGKKIFANAGNLDYDFFKAQLKNYFEEIKPIYENAHERSLKYYKSHLNELLSGLKQEAKRYAALAASVERDKAGKITHQLKPIEIENFKRDFKNEIAPYLEMLKENRPQDYEEIISFTDYSYEHRDEFFEEQEALKKNSLTPNSSLKTPSNPLSLMACFFKRAQKNKNFKITA